MILRHVLTVPLMALLVLIGGCATGPSAQHTDQQAVSSAPVFISQDQARQLAFVYRREAADLRELARRLEAESTVLGRMSTRGQAQGLTIQIKDVLAAADDADERAREYQRHVPHGRLQ